MIWRVPEISVQLQTSASTHRNAADPFPQMAGFIARGRLHVKPSEVV
jgi:hypothetical protein